jgi:hypothetical protein
MAAVEERIGFCPHGVINDVCVRCTLGDQISAGVLISGDTMFFSVELLRQITDEPNPVLVRVKEIRTEAEGTKVLWLEKA